jgi:hypothetical protein
MQAESAQLERRSDLPDPELKATRQITAQIQDNTKRTQMVDFCSPLQRRRIDILRGFMIHADALKKVVFATLGILFVGRCWANVGTTSRFATIGMV